MYFYGSLTAGDPVEIAVVEWEIELELCKVLCLLGEQHVVSGGVIWKQLSMPVAVVFAG